MELSAQKEICTCYHEKTSDDLALLSLDCPMHHQRREINPFDNDRPAMSPLATEDVCRTPLSEAGQAEKMRRHASRYADLAKTIVPLAIIGLLTHAPTVVTSFMCGHLNSTAAQAAAGLAMSTSNFAGTGFVLGSQAFGAGRKLQFGTLTIRALLMSLTCCCYIVVIWFFSCDLFASFNDTKKETNYLAGLMLRLLCVSLPFSCVDFVMTKFMIIAGLAIEAVYLRIWGICVHGIVSYILIYTVDLRLEGAAVSLILSQIITSCSIAGYLAWSGEVKDYWAGFSWDVLRGWGKMASLGLPGIIMIVSQGLAIEGTIMLMSEMDIDQYDAFLQMMQYHQIYFHMYHGFSVASAIVTGRNLGAQDPAKARKDAAEMGIFSLCSGIAFAVITFCFRYQIAALLSESPEVEEWMLKYVTVYMIYVIVDCVQVTISGNLRGMGKQALGALLMFLGLFVVGLGLAAILIYNTTLQGVGVWLSLSCGSVSLVVAFSVVIHFTDWIKETDKALDKLGVVNQLKGSPDTILIDNVVARSDSPGWVNLDPTEGAPARKKVRFSRSLINRTDSETSPLFDKCPSSKETKVVALFMTLSFVVMVVAIVLWSVFHIAPDGGALIHRP